MKGSRIKELREKKGYSQTDFAKEVGLSRPWLSLMEAGKVKLPKKRLKKICELLDVTIDQLLGDEKSVEENKDPINREYLAYSMEIADSITDASDLSKSERVELLESIYKMVHNFFEKKLTEKELDEEISRLKKESVRDVKIKQNFFKLIEKKLIKKPKNGS